MMVNKEMIAAIFTSHWSFEYVGAPASVSKPWGANCLLTPLYLRRPPKRLLRDAPRGVDMPMMLITADRVRFSGVHT